MLKILFLAANPADTERLRLDEEVRAIDKVLNNARYRDSFELKSHWAVQVDDLQDLLLRYRPDIVHFSGHGSGSSEIVLHDHSGRSVPVPPLALALLFRTLKDNIRCVVLNCCYSADQAAAIAQHIDCVVGVPDAISDVAARYFAASFYQGLAYGRTVGESYNLGTVQLSLHGLADEDKPRVLGAADPTSLCLVSAEEAAKREVTDPASALRLDAPTSVYARTRHPLPSVATPRVGRLPDPLTEQDLREFLEKHAQWALVDTRDENASEGVRRELYRVYEFPSYQLAFRFMNEVSERAIVRQSHHPRWQNTWNRVEIWLTTFNLGYRPSTKDLRLAEACEQAWRELRRSFVW
jgi:pterin-4a-carbinolamine dehydratase